jgi:hypothetical protein
VADIAAVFPPRTHGALARILHGAKAIRVSFEPLNAADQPGQITEVFNQCATLLGPALRAELNACIAAGALGMAFSDTRRSSAMTIANALWFIDSHINMLVVHGVVPSF